MTKEFIKQQREGPVDPAIQILKDWIEKEYNKPHVTDIRDKHLASLESNDQFGLKELLHRLDGYIGYWNEKMRDTQEERQYMVNLKSARQFLASKVETEEKERSPEETLFRIINIINGKKFEEGQSTWAAITLQVPNDLTTLRMKNPDLSPEEYAEKLIDEPGHLNYLIADGKISKEDSAGRMLRKALIKFIEATS